MRSTCSLPVTYIFNISLELPALDTTAMNVLLKLPIHSEKQVNNAAIKSYAAIATYGIPCIIPPYCPYLTITTDQYRMELLNGDSLQKLVCALGCTGSHAAAALGELADHGEPSSFC